MKYRIRTIIQYIFLVIFISFWLIIPVAEILAQYDKGICYYDYKFETAQVIGNASVAPLGHQYIIATVYIKNDAWLRQVETDPDYWSFHVDNITYSGDSATYEYRMKNEITYFWQGQEAEIHIVFLVPDTVNTGYITYDPDFHPSPEFKRIQYY